MKHPVQSPVRPDVRESPAYAVPPVERAFRLLRHMAAGDTVANVSVTARALGISRTTLIRLVATLEAERMIERKSDGSGYGLGLGLVGLAGQALNASDLVQVGDPVIANLARSLSLSAHIGVLEGRDVLYVARRTPNVHLVSNVGIGSRLPGHATTMGRIMIAHMPEEEIAALYEGVDLQRVTEKTPASLPALLVQRDADAKAGIAWSDSHFERGIASAAAALFDRFGKVIGAINVTGPSAAFSSPAGRRAEISEALTAAAGMISGRLGHVAQGQPPHDLDITNGRRMQ
jgi:DNA-binding IclR family transcriptional regulator